MAEEEKKVGRPRKEKPKLTNAPIQFVADEELGITDMQAGFATRPNRSELGDETERQLKSNSFLGAT